jgi:hypothetical protein
MGWLNINLDIYEVNTPRTGTECLGPYAVTLLRVTSREQLRNSGPSLRDAPVLGLLMRFRIRK